MKSFGVAVTLALAASAAAAQERVSAVEIRALLTAGKVEQAIDSYGRYMSDRREEDRALLSAIGQATLRQLAAAGQSEALTAMALERLARLGDERARQALALAATGERTLMPQGLAADASLARLGDAKAAARLLEMAGQTGTLTNRAALIDAIRTARVPGAGSTLQKLLDDPAPPVRAAAADALGALGVKEAAPRLRSMLDDRTLLTRVAAASALKRLGDASADTLLAEWLTSDLPDLRLMAAAAYAGSSDRAWVSAIRPLLSDPNGINRLRAAELLLAASPEPAPGATARGVREREPSAAATREDAERPAPGVGPRPDEQRWGSAGAEERVQRSARETLIKAAFDANPAVRTEAARLLAATPPPDVSVLRRLLGDESAWVRLHAAGALVTVQPEKPAPPPAKK